MTITDGNVRVFGDLTLGANSTLDLDGVASGLSVIGGESVIEGLVNVMNGSRFVVDGSSTGGHIASSGVLHVEGVGSTMRFRGGTLTIDGLMDVTDGRVARLQRRRRGTSFADLGQWHAAGRRSRYTDERRRGNGHHRGGPDAGDRVPSLGGWEGGEIVVRPDGIFRVDGVGTQMHVGRSCTTTVEGQMLVTGGASLGGWEGGEIVVTETGLVRIADAPALHINADIEVAGEFSLSAEAASVYCMVLVAPDGKFTGEFAEELLFERPSEGIPSIVVETGGDPALR